jgi:hypothetical protein
MSVIEVEQMQTKDGIKVVLHRLEFAAECMAAFLTVENTSDGNSTIKILDKGSVAIHGDYESKVTSSGPSYKRLRKEIKYGTKDYGAVKFERLQHNEPAIRFEFQLSESGPDRFHGGVSWLFVFEVQIQK